MRTNSYKISPEFVRANFTYDLGLYRRLADGGYRPVTNMEGGQLCCNVQGERLRGADIAWCLYYGNWPKFHLSLLDGNPMNLDISNLMAVRGQTIRCRLKPVRGGFRHGLSTVVLTNETLAREHWARAAYAKYAPGLRSIIEEEAIDRERRAATIEAKPELRPATRIRLKPRGVSAPSNRPPKPEPVDGKVWHYHEGAWVLLPPACHVADDWHVRARKVLAGAVRFEFNHTYEEVWGYSADGAVVV